MLDGDGDTPLLTKLSREQRSDEETKTEKDIVPGHALTKVRRIEQPHDCRYG